MNPITPQTLDDALDALAAFLEAALGLCLGCKAFGILMRLGVIPQSICEECGDLTKRYPSLG